MNLVESNFKFDWVEYSVVAVMLLLSSLIGVYFSCFTNQKTFSEYMLGGKSMGVFPVSMSLVASYVSGLTLLGVPAEAYTYGTQYAVFNFNCVLVIVITLVFFLPIYFKLQLNSLFEYLELRFDHNVRLLGTFLFSLSLIMFLPVVIYIPALAFNQVTDVSVHVVTPIITAICVFYTAFGGLRAVLWTDALQNLFTLLAVVFVVVLGCGRLGGIQEVLRINQEGHRLELFNMDPDPFARHTFFTIFVGGTFMTLTNFGVNPGAVQRYLTVPTLGKARQVLLFSGIGFIIINNLATLLGMVLYGRYHDCDPVAAKVIKSSGQIVPLYVMEIGEDYPGLAGLFMCGVLSAALSTMSAWLNTVGGTLYKDIMEVFFPKVQHSDAKQSNIIKTIVVVLGVLCVILVTVVEKLGSLFQMALSLLGIVYGSILALFTLGMFFPRANVKGAMVGTVASLFLTGLIAIHAQYYILKGKLRFPGKITSVDHCPLNILESFNTSSANVFTYTGVGSEVIADDSVPLIYRVSFSYYSVIGTLTGILIGMVVSLLTEPPDLHTINPDLFSPYVHGLLPNRGLQRRPNKEEYRLTRRQDSCEAQEIKAFC